MGEISKVFKSRFPIHFTDKLANTVIKYVYAYECKDKHPEALNSPYLGLFPMYFKTSDRDGLFELFDLPEVQEARSSFIKDGFSNPFKGTFELFNYVMQLFSKDNLVLFNTDTRNSIKGAINDNKKTPEAQAIIKFKTDNKNISSVLAGDIRKMIAEMESVDENFVVASDPFNLFITYAVHSAWTSDLKPDLKYKTCFKLIMLLQYKFFTSLVNYRFRYRPNEDVMRAMFEGLSDKFDIKKKGTWRAVMESRAEDFLGPNSIHKNMLDTYENDKGIIYFITDLQTRIRNQINIIVAEFMLAKEREDAIGSYSTVSEDDEGEKVIIDNKSMFDTMTANIYSDSLSIGRFIEPRILTAVCGQFNEVAQSMFRSVLIAFSEIATKQVKSGETRLVKEIDGNTVDIGAHILIEHILQKTYRYCITKGTDIKPLKVLKDAQDAYRSSRITDEGIVRVRNSVAYLISQINPSQRAATVSSIRIAFVTYILMLSFKYIKH